MGILNLTPDSFHDGGAWDKPSAALGQAERMLNDGADVLDLGAQSTRPGAEVLGAEAEWQRLEPVLVALKSARPDAIVSVDTFHAEVARRALAEGADIINDVSGGDADPDMWKVVAQARAPYVLMHMQGTPATMQNNPTYDDVVHEVVTHLGGIHGHRTGAASCNPRGQRHGPHPSEPAHHQDWGLGFCPPRGLRRFLRRRFPPPLDSPPEAWP